MNIQLPTSNEPHEEGVRFEDLAEPARTLEERLRAMDVWGMSDGEAAELMGELIARDRARDAGSWGGASEERRKERMRQRAAGDYLTGRNREES